ncbi:MAG: 16S rRNA (cytosine(1402)-N(4))-methyltransferase RsmH [Nitrospinae bacterium]|nr:16S rRNA (cytosine(1402)-N(4))-methyltransferase RsmH [Nitrospinota bacterium]
MSLGSSNDEAIRHEPVLLGDVLRVLDPRPGGLYVDCTLGGAGHAAAILEKAGEGARLIGLDRDAQALERSGKRLGAFGGRVELHCERFENIGAVLAGRMPDGILMDLGVSSFMLDDPARGFSFRADGPLDMRMDRSQELTAATIVNTWSAEELATVFRTFGEERHAGRVARRIVREREKEAIVTTLRLADIVSSVVPKGKFRIHPATRVFMALRIAVNGELDRLEEALLTAVDLLVPGGRLAVITFHSLEDRIVKQTFARLAKGCVCPPRLPVCVCGKKARVKPVTKKPVGPTDEETARNPRARSAFLRAVQKEAA